MRRLPAISWAFVFSFVTALATVVTTADAADFAKGDQVLIELPGQKGKGVIESKVANSLYRIKATEGNLKGQTMTLPNQFLKPLAMPADENPFAPNDGLDVMREWADATGKYKIEAKFIKYDGTNITLERKDGRQVTLALAKLSKADQDFVKAARSAPSSDSAGYQVNDKIDAKWGSSWWAAKIIEIKDGKYKIKYDSDSSEEWLPLEKIRKRDAPRGSDSKPATAPDVPMVKADWGSVNRLALGRNPRTSEFEPDAASSYSAVFDPITLRGPNGSFWENPTSLSVNAELGMAVVSHKYAPPGKSTTTRIEFCDLKGGRSLQGPTIAEGMHVFGLSPDGKQLLTRLTKFGFGESSRLDLWDVNGAEVARTKSWVPYESVTKTERDVSWCEWVDSEHLLSLNNGGTLVCWNASSATAVYELATGRGKFRPGLSANRRHVSVVMETGVEILEAATGTLLHRIATDTSSSNAALAFSPNGSSVALLASGRLRAWSLVPVAELCDVAVAGAVSVDRLDWVSDDFVLANQQWLLNPKNKALVWNYGTPPANAYTCDNTAGFFWYVPNQDKREALVPVKIPHDAALAYSKTLSTPKFVVEPGMTIGLQVDVKTSPENVEKIKRALSARLNEAGFKTSTSGSVTLVAKSQDGKEKTVSYMGFGGGDKVKYKEQICWLELLVGGKSVWKRQTVVTAPGLLQRKDGESIDDAVHRQVQPQVSFYTGQWVPSLVQEPDPNPTRHMSKLTLAGIN